MKILRTLSRDPRAAVLQEVAATGEIPARGEWSELWVVESMRRVASTMSEILGVWDRTHIVIDPDEPECSAPEGHEWEDARGKGVAERVRCRHCGQIKEVEPWHPADDRTVHYRAVRYPVWGMEWHDDSA